MQVPIAGVRKLSGNSKAKTPSLLKARSLSRELAFSLVILVLLFEGFFSFFSITVRPNSLSRELEKKADEYAVNLSEILRVPLWDYDDEQIRMIGDGYRPQPVGGRLQCPGVRW